MARAASSFALGFGLALAALVAVEELRGGAGPPPAAAARGLGGAARALTSEQHAAAQREIRPGEEPLKGEASADAHRAHGGDGAGEHHHHEANATAHGANGTNGTGAEAAVYDEHGWHLKQDFVSRALRPDELQPFYMMPVFFGTKLLLTMGIFGFSLRFKEEQEPVGMVATMRATLKKVAKPLSQLAFIAMAVNGYVSDYREFARVSQLLDGFWKKACAGVIIVLTSANYVAARAMLGSLLQEGPAQLLSLLPTYQAVPFLGLPLVPGGAKWMPPLKHIYVLILLPYYFMFKMSLVGVQITLYGWLCATRCMALWGLCVANCNCICALLGCVVSFGLWAWAKACFGYWWPLEAPFWYQVLIQIWATVVCPPLFAGLYALLIGASWQDLTKGMMTGMIYGSAPFLGIDADDRQRLIELNQDILKDDFRALLGDGGPGAAAGGAGASKAGAGAEAKEEGAEAKEEGAEAKEEGAEAKEEGAEGAPASSSTVSLDDTKIHIFLGCLKDMSSIVIEQVVFIFLVRAIWSSSFEGYVGALQLTLSERHWYTYMGTMQRLAERSKAKALDCIWMFL